MSIENISPTLFSIGSGGVIGFLIGFALKRVMKIIAVIAGVFLAANTIHTSFGGYKHGLDSGNIHWHNQSFWDIISQTFKEKGFFSVQQRGFCQVYG